MARLSKEARSDDRFRNIKQTIAKRLQPAWKEKTPITLIEQQRKGEQEVQHAKRENLYGSVAEVISYFFRKGSFEPVTFQGPIDPVYIARLQLHYHFDLC